MSPEKTYEKRGKTVALTAFAVMSECQEGILKASIPFHNAQIIISFTISSTNWFNLRRAAKFAPFYKKSLLKKSAFSKVTDIYCNYLLSVKENIKT